MARYVLVKFEKDEEADEFQEGVEKGNWDTIAPDEIIYYTESLTEMWREMVKKYG